MSEAPDYPEILPPETSNEEMVRKFLENEMSNPRGPSCRGNLGNDCVQKSLSEAAEVLEGRDDYTTFGGFPVQIKVVDRSGFEIAWELFSHRTTNDLDILSMNPRETSRLFEDKRYSNENLEVDLIGVEMFDNPDIGEELIRDSEETTVDEIGLEGLRVPTDTGLLYSKLHDGYARVSRGTRYDAWRMLNSDQFYVDHEELEEYMRGNLEARETYNKLTEDH